MKFFFVYLLAFFILAWSPPASAQKNGRKSKLDSIKAELRLTRTDTARIRLRYLIGANSHVLRPPFWDSLMKDAHKLGMKRYEAKALVSKSNALFMHESYENAIESCNEAYRMLEKAGTRTDLLDPIFISAVCYHRKNNFKKSLEYCFEGLKIAEELKNSEWTDNFLNFISTCYLSIGEIEKAS